MLFLFQNKRWILVVAFLALGALTVLAIGLRDVSFREAQPVGWREAQAATTPAAPLESPKHVPVQSRLVVWMAFLLMVILIGLLVNPETRKRMLKIFFRVALFYWAWYLVVTRHPEVITSLVNGLNLAGQAGEIAGSENLPPAVFEPPQESPWLSYLVAVIFILLLVFLAWRANRFWRNYTGQGANNSLDEIARIARSSLTDLSAGRESTDVIMNCYFRMSDVVTDKRGLQRGTSMTPAEFAIRLERAGLPGEAVKRLTRLFENVRYGGYRTGPREVNEAVACLTTILNYCGEAV